MKAVVIYESMYGNTHRIASAIAAGFRRHGEAVVVPVRDADAALVASADLAVVGGPTHAKGIEHKLRHHGATLICEPESFFVKKGNHLEPSEEARANEWGERLGITLDGS